MVYNNSLTFSPYLESSSTKTNISEEKEITLLREYFSKLNGSPHAFEDIQPLLPELFHPDFKMVVSSKTDPSGKELNYDEFIEILAKFCENGCIANLERAEKNRNEETVTCIINNILPNEKDDTTEQTAYYKDGKIIRVEATPLDSLKFGCMIGRVKDLPATEEDVLEKYRALINVFDGSPDAFQRAKPLADKIYHPNVVFELSDNEKHDYDWFLRFLASISEGQLVAKLEELERINDSGEVKAVIRAFVNGKDMGSGERRMLVKNNKIVYFKHVSPIDEQEFRKLTNDALLSSPENDRDDPVQATNDDVLEKFRALIHVFDGSPDAFHRAKPLADEIYDPNVVFELSESEKQDYNWYLRFLASMSEGRNVAKLEELKRINGSGEVEAVIHAFVNGEDMGSGERRMLVKDNKIVYFKHVSPSDEQQFRKLANRVMVSSPGSDRDDPVLEKFKAFIGAFDGSPGALSKAEAVMDDLYDHDAFRSRIGKDGPEKDYEWLLGFVANYAGERNIARIVELERTDSGLRTVIHNTVKGKDMGATEQRGIVKNGKIVYWEAAPSDEEDFKAMVDRVESKDGNDELIEKYRAFIDAFDGSPGAFEKGKPFMDDIFDKDTLIIRTGQGEEGKDYEWFLDFVATFAGDRNVARIVKLERTDTGLRTVIHNTVKGKDMGTAEQRGIVKNGKIVYWEAVPSNEKDFAAMIEHVMSK